MKLMTILEFSNDYPDKFWQLRNFDDRILKRIQNMGIDAILDMVGGEHHTDLIKAFNYGLNHGYEAFKSGDKYAHMDAKFILNGKRLMRQMTKDGRSSNKSNMYDVDSIIDKSIAKGEIAAAYNSGIRIGHRAAKKNESIRKYMASDMNSMLSGDVNDFDDMDLGDWERLIKKFKITKNQMDLVSQELNYKNFSDLMTHYTLKDLLDYDGSMLTKLNRALTDFTSAVHSKSIDFLKKIKLDK